MGMFDHIDFECDCPHCGERVSGFQSKDGPCALLRLHPSKVSHFYRDCPGCGHWLEFDVEEPTSLKVRERATDLVLEIPEEKR